MYSVHENGNSGAKSLMERIRRPRGRKRGVMSKKMFVLFRALSLLALLAAWVPVNQTVYAAAVVPPADLFQLPWDQGLAWMAIDGLDNGTKRPLDSSHQFTVGGAIDFAPHRDMAVGENTSNFWVTAVAAGTVIEKSFCHLKIRHENGWISEYQFLANVQVKVGDAVFRNQRLGIIANGSSQPFCPGSQDINVPHLHFMLRPGTESSPVRYFAVSDFADPRTLPWLAYREGVGALWIEHAADFAAAHIPGTINIPLNRAFTGWAGWLIPYDRDFYLLIDHAREDAVETAARDLAMIGLDPVRGLPRFTFGKMELMDGIGFVPVIMGLFGLAEILENAEQHLSQVVATKVNSIVPTRQDLKDSIGRSWQCGTMQVDFEMPAGIALGAGGSETAPIGELPVHNDL